MYLFLVTLGLHCCACISLVAAHRLLLAVASFVAEHGLWGSQAVVVGAHGLSSCSSWGLRHRLRSCGARA